MKKKLNYSYFIGIDVAKKSLDITIINSSSTIISYCSISNDIKSIKKYFLELEKMEIIREDTLVCCETTGIYINPLCYALSELECNLWVVPAIEIKRSTGLVRGKNDKSDSKAIALYAITKQNRFTPFVLPSENIEELKKLQTERDKFIECIKSLKTTSEIKGYMRKKTTENVLRVNECTVRFLEKKVKEIETIIDKIVKSDETIKKQLTLITSITGIGKNTALYLIIATGQFQKFKEWRQLSCYAGLAPFEYSSGTSIKGRRKVNHFADKKLKSLLHMCALSAIKHNKELNIYYKKKKEEGKHNLLVINNVKNKLIARVFAVIKREEPYINTFKWAR